MPARYRRKRGPNDRLPESRYGPRPTVSDPRRHLLAAVLAFVRNAQDMQGVRRISLLGSLATDKPVPKDADVLVTIDDSVDFDVFARRARGLKGATQRINLGADIFLADDSGRYIGRVCLHRECFPRRSCQALHCGRRQHLRDDLQVVTLAPALIAEPPIDLRPRIVRRCTVPTDVEALLLTPLEGTSTS